MISPTHLSCHKYGYKQNIRLSPSNLIKISAKRLKISAKII
jgi:hypothetical protein